MPTFFAPDHFAQTLLETIYWCHHRLLETPHHNLLWSLADSETSLFKLERTENGIRQFCDQIISIRSQQMRHLERPKYEDIRARIQGGRLMLFLYQCSFNDGTAQIVSEGYFDYSNYPPWDTWIYHGDQDATYGLTSYIIAWVPHEFVRQAQEGIEMCPCESLLWMDRAISERPQTPYLKAMFSIYKNLIVLMSYSNAD